MVIAAHQRAHSDPETPDAPDPAAVREAAAWAAQLLRTVKTCRLYDGANPIVVRFREALASSLARLLSQFGPLRLEVGSSTLAWGGQTVLAAHSRDDNLSAVLHRDGLRVLTLEPGIEGRELNSLLDLILRVSGPSAGEDDLVTLLWDADLPHVAIEAVPIEGEADGGSEEGDGNTPALAWPSQGAGAPQSGEAGEGSDASTPEGSDASTPEASRSDDCLTGERPADLEQAFDELETVALFEIARFQEERAAEDGKALVTRTLEILEDCLASDLTPADRAELAAFIPRALREALVLGDWQGAAVALRLIRACDPQWSGDEFSRGLSGPFAITTRKVVAVLDGQDQAAVESFFMLARELGSPVAEWLMHVLAESQQMRVRRPLARTIAELLPGQPDRVLPWLSDGRWYVVRNAVHILGWIGGNDIVRGLQTAAEHPEPRVRREVVAALSQMDHDASRPILTNMLKSAGPELLGALLHQLAMDDDPSVAGKLLELLRDPGFHARSDVERRGLFLALASRGEPVLPALEAELNAGGWFSRRPGPDHRGIALCIARIGTPAARAILERGLRSKHAPIRKACVIAGASGTAGND